MIGIFAKDWTGEPFDLFGPGHLIALAVIFLINLSFIWLGKSQNQKLKDLEDKIEYLLKRLG